MNIKTHSFIFLLICLLSITVHAQPVKKHGFLKVEGIQFIDQHNQPVILRGMSFGWHNFWPRFYNEGTVKWLYDDWKCSVVRAAMGVEPDKGYIKDPIGSKALIKKVIDASIKAGIYVIIDWHSHNINLNEAKVFFKEMAETYKDHPNIIYELFNEPDQETWPEVKAYATEVIEVIRKIDKRNIIIVGSPHWDQDIQLPAEDPIKGFNNIVYSVHFYAATHKQWLRDKCDKALASGLPLFISESAGMEASGDGAINYEEWQKWIEWAEQHQISWVIWSVSDKDETCSVLKKSAPSEGNWKDSDLKESGILSRALLKKYASK